MKKGKKYLKMCRRGGAYIIDDITLNKAEIIEKCLRRIKEEYADDVLNLSNYTKQDSIILNILRACEAAIDIAMHIVSEKKLGIPQNSRDAFDILNQNGIIDEDLSRKMKSMIGFRNLAVHNYQNIDLEIVQSIIKNNLVDLISFKKKILKDS
jgi:uncharacterized protein YutE (UPF0331/DUF86 family)